MICFLHTTGQNQWKWSTDLKDEFTMLIDKTSIHIVLSILSFIKIR